jgi:hypothetical protein
MGLSSWWKGTGTSGAETSGNNYDNEAEATAGIISSKRGTDEGVVPSMHPDPDDGEGNDKKLVTANNNTIIAQQQQQLTPDEVVAKFSDSFHRHFLSWGDEGENNNNWHAPRLLPLLFGFGSSDNAYNSQAYREERRRLFYVWFPVTAWGVVSGTVTLLAIRGTLRTRAPKMFQDYQRNKKSQLKGNPYQQQPAYNQQPRQPTGVLRQRQAEAEAHSHGKRGSSSGHDAAALEEAVASSFFWDFNISLFVGLNVSVFMYDSKSTQQALADIPLETTRGNHNKSMLCDYLCGDFTNIYYSTKHDGLFDWSHHTNMDLLLMHQQEQQDMLTTTSRRDEDEDDKNEEGVDNNHNRNTKNATTIDDDGGSGITSRISDYFKVEERAPVRPLTLGNLEKFVHNCATRRQRERGGSFNDHAHDHERTLVLNDVHEPQQEDEQAQPQPQRKLPVIVPLHEMVQRNKMRRAQERARDAANK